jgi:riboflavin kinase / FMN adenylyltransferase
MSAMTICFDVPHNPFPTAVALGTFDGVHLGHQQVLQHMQKAAQQEGLQGWVFTFKNHPKAVVPPFQAPPLLSTWQEKITLLNHQVSPDGIVLQSFDQSFSHMSPECFVEDILCTHLQAKHISVGYNFRFGYQAKGDVHLLQTMGESLGFSVSVVPAYAFQEETVSSSRIRTYLLAGELDQALPLLGGRYLIQGEVIHGQGLAAKFLGVPTANLAFDQEHKALPPKGVYACEIQINGSHQLYQGVLNLGLRPTFSGEGLNLEAHLLDFEGDLYGQTLQVYFKAFIRPEQKFDGPEALKAQIHQDIAQTRQHLDALRP